MLPERSFTTVQALWPLFERAGKSRQLEPTLLLAVAWVESGLDAARVSAQGARGLMQMSPLTAGVVAGKLGLAKWDLLDPATALDFGAFYLAEQFARFVLPRVAVAAYHAGPGAVARAGNQVPANPTIERYARNVMAVWEWLRGHLGDVLQRPSDPPEGKQWRLIAPPDRWRDPVAVPPSALPVLEALAERLSLAFHRDDALRKLYLGLPRPVVETPPKNGRLILPIPGATRANSGAYSVDSGLDVIVPVGTPVVAAGAGTIVYSEWGHTKWTDPPDTPGSILIRLDVPFEHKRVQYGLTWYTHLSRLRFQVPDGSGRGPRVAQGELIGWSGVGNRVPHLHFGVVADRAQTVFVPPFQLAAYFGWMGGER